MMLRLGACLLLSPQSGYPLQVLTAFRAFRCYPSRSRPYDQTQYIRQTSVYAVSASAKTIIFTEPNTFTR